MAEQTEKGRLNDLITHLRVKIQEGYSLAEAMMDYPHVFTDLYCASIQAGQQTGRLDAILERLAAYTENQQAIRQKIQQALIYPLVMISVSLIIICFLLAFVVPKIIEVFTASGQTLPLMTDILIQISHFTQHYGLYALLFLLLVGLGFKQSLQKTVIKKKWHRFLLRIPVYGHLTKTANVARYMHTFSMLFSAGVPVLDTMKTATQIINNLIIQKAFTEATLKVRKGISISLALKETRYLSPMAVHLISSGEKSGQLPDMMTRAAATMDADVKRAIETGLTLLEPLIILIMGAVVLFIVLSTLLPIFSMEQLV